MKTISNMPNAKFMTIAIILTMAAAVLSTGISQGSEDEESWVKCPVLEEVILKDVTVYTRRNGFLLGVEVPKVITCTDSLVIKDINLRVERIDNCSKGSLYGCGGGGRGSGWILLNDTDTLRIICNWELTHWYNNGVAYWADIDDDSFKKLRDALILFDNSPSPCLGGNRIFMTP